MEYVKKQKLELESSLRIEVQKWRSDAEFADRKLRNCEEELRNNKNKMKEMKNDLENTQRLHAQKNTSISQLDGDYNSVQEKYHKLE